MQEYDIDDWQRNTVYRNYAKLRDKSFGFGKLLSRMITSQELDCYSL